MADPAIQTRALSRNFGTKLAVSDLSLTVPRGEVFGFLGHNGAGKTTSLKMLLGLVAPTAGAGEVLGKAIGDCATRARIGYLPEHFRFHDCLTGRELLRFHGRMYGLGGAALDVKIDDLLLRMQLDDAADRPVSQYSKGMTQRVGLAQALLNDPELVFLDEPTSGLDPIGRRLVRDVIHDLRRRGTTVFLNSHLLGEVEATCDRVAFIKDGRTVEELSLHNDGGALDVELRLGPVAPQILEGLARFGDLPPEGGSHGINGGSHAINGRVHLRVATEAVVPEIARWLVATGVPIYELHSRRRTLEERFIDVMGSDQRAG